MQCFPLLVRHLHPFIIDLQFLITSFRLAFTSRAFDLGLVHEALYYQNFPLAEPHRRPQIVRGHPTDFQAVLDLDAPLVLRVEFRIRRPHGVGFYSYAVFCC